MTHINVAQIGGSQTSRPAIKVAVTRALESPAESSGHKVGTARHATYKLLIYGVPKGIRTPVTAVKGRCPGPLDDGDRVPSAIESLCTTP